MIKDDKSDTKLWHQFGEGLEDAVKKYLNINRNWWELCKTPRRIGYNIRRYAEGIIGIN